MSGPHLNPYKPSAKQLERYKRWWLDNYTEAEIAEFAYAFRQLLGPTDALSLRELGAMKKKAA